MDQVEQTLPDTLTILADQTAKPCITLTLTKSVLKRKEILKPEKNSPTIMAKLTSTNISNQTDASVSITCSKSKSSTTHPIGFFLKTWYIL